MAGIGLNASLLMATRSLLAQRQAIEVAGHNLANVNTPGAARQRVDLRSDAALLHQGPLGQQGLGVYVQEIQSVRSPLLDTQVVRQESYLGFEAEVAMLGRLLEQTLGENFTTSQLQSIPGVQSLTGMQNSLNAFFDSWNQLAADPTSAVARREVLTRAEAVASDIRSAYDRVMEAKEGLFPEAVQVADRVNVLAGQLADLNEQISRVEVGVNNPANDLRDQRQMILEELAGLVNITVTENAGNDRMVDVALADNPSVLLVTGVSGAGEDASYSLGLTAAYDASTNSSLQFTATSATAATINLTATQPSLGRLGGLVEVATVIIGNGHASGSATLAGRLNQFAENLRTAVNGLHQGTTTWDADGVNGGAFFSGTAQNFAVAITDPDAVAAAGGATNPGPLDATVARAIAALRSDEDLGEYHRQTTANLGLQVQQAQRAEKAQQLVADQIRKEREAVSGISIDEEMTNLITFQRAFEASARLINTLDEMMRTVTSLGR